MNPTIKPSSGTSADFDQQGVLQGTAVGVCCPACSKELQLGEMHGCQFAGCPDCKGMLFQQDVFANLIQHLRATSQAGSRSPQPMDPSDLSVRRQCPTCGLALETHSYAGPGNSVVDTCIGCGIIWLDQGELTRLVDAPGKGRL